MKKDSFTIDVKIRPLSKKTGFDGFLGKRLKINVASAAEKGKANRELIEQLAKAFDIRKSDVTIIRGERSRVKTLALSGDHERLKARYEELLKRI